MEHTRDHIRSLLRKQLEGSLTDAERKSLQQWADAHPANREVLDRTSRREHFMADLEVFGSLDDLTAQITAYVRERRPEERRLLSMRRWLPYAAAILLALTGGWLFFGKLFPPDDRPEIGLMQEIQPGGNRATLTLADGRTIHLDEAQTGIQVGAADITYADGESLGVPLSEELVLTTPKGGTYQITLLDGSKVWLNANSTLIYPTRFSDETRNVRLTGEAYFDVAKSEVPFRVTSTGQTVEVLGTAFNLSAYPDEPETKTTLVEGKVRLQVSSTGASVLLVPGDQGLLVNDLIETKRVDTDQYTAWKDGRFMFDGKPFDQIMRELGRWYDLEIQYEGPVPQAELFGDAFRNENLSFVLKLLDNGGFNYTLDGRTLIIKTKEGGNR